MTGSVIALVSLSLPVFALNRGFVSVFMETRGISPPTKVLIWLLISVIQEFKKQNKTANSLQGTKFRWLLMQ